MELIDYHGVPIAMLSVEEALSSDWDWAAGRVDVVRVEDPEARDWPALRARGLLPKPQQVTWVADACETEEAYMAGLTSAERQKIRGARVRTALDCIDISVRELDERLFEEFLVVYSEAVRRMRHGINVAVGERDTILAERASYVVLCARDGARLIGCCLARREHVLDTLRVRFSAVDHPHRESSLARVLYMEAGRVTRELGHRTLSLGKDRNLYGHVAKPGLLRFKRQLGFVPRPSHLVDPSVGYDQADVVLRLSELEDPSMFLSYVDDVPSDRLQLEVFTGLESVELRPFAGKFAAGARTHRIGAAKTPMLTEAARRC